MIKVHGLTKRYGATTAIDDVSFSVRRGEIFAILGPNGSGKTTILKCIAGLVAPTAGEVLIGDKSIAGNRRDVRCLFSYLPQRVSFPESLTAREVLQFYCRLRRQPAEAVESALRDARLDGFADRPQREYSGGMVQRLGLAVALLPGAPVLLLDEPTAGLDPEVTLELRRHLPKLRDQGTTVVLASHMLPEVEAVADRVAILVRGRIVAVESVLALRERVMQVSLLRLALLNPDPQWCSLARTAGAQSAELLDHSLLVSCRADDRPLILRSLQAAGARIESFSTQEPSLEEIYLRCVNESSDGGVTTAGHGVPGRTVAAGGH